MLYLWINKEMCVKMPVAKVVLMYQMFQLNHSSS